MAEFRTIQIADGGTFSGENMSTPPTKRRGGPIVLLALALMTLFVATLCLPVTALAAVEDHTVSGVSPRGTTINLFDYWIDGQNEPDGSNPNNYLNRGINAGRTLKFGAGMGQSEGAVNQWTGTAEPYQGIVSNILGSNGYPTLNQTLGGDSLAYLFNSRSFDGKRAYMGVSGLLQVDSEGYYYYDSQKNFAEFDADTNSFTLYDTWGVNAGGQSPDGQFFPFNTRDQVFHEDGNGQLVQNNITSTNSVIKHYFGLSMSTRFVQQYGGHTDETGQRDVTYNFSGDDDVWIFIDDVLVGDLGGIHNATSIQINFSDGSVIVYADRNNNNQYDRDHDGTPYQDTTLKQLFTKAGREGNINWNGDTFADDTYHTLDFFYLERGNTDSNMSLRYNLVNIPESGIIKVDQIGTPLEDVAYELYPANENYEITSSAYYTGTTDANGELTFTTTEGSASGEPIPVSLEQLNTISDYWVLRETNVPEGYRSPGDMYLRFQDGVLLSSNEWDTGAYSQPHVTATATNTVYEYGDVTGSGHDADAGTMFAVVLQKQADGTWAPVSGDAFSGWVVGESIGTNPATVTQSVLDAATDNPYQFLVSSGGAYQVDIENLPGDITTYEYMVENNNGSADQVKYSVAYYYTTADSISGATTGNTFRMEANKSDDYDGFDRIFSVTLNISNIKDGFTVVKTNELTGDPISGVEFKLYKDTNVDGVLDDTEKNDNNVVFTGKTGTDGTLTVPGADGTLTAGNYVLVETVPNGFAAGNDGIAVVVDSTGVYVDAGTEDDNVSVETRLGALVYSMRGFAADDKVDATLHEVKAQPQTADAYAGDATDWTDATTEELHFQYQDRGDGRNELTYQPSGGSAAGYVAEAGWSRLDVTQCLDEAHETGNGTDYKEDLGDQSLNALFTGNVIVHVTNMPTGTLTIEKVVEGAGAPEDDVFDFSIGLVDASGAAVTGTFDVTYFHADGTTTTDTLTFQDAAEKNLISLAAGDRVAITGLPEGTTYTVTETAGSDYVTTNTVNGAASEDGLVATGTVSSDSESAVVFTNTFDEGVPFDPDGALGVAVSKQVEGNGTDEQMSPEGYVFELSVRNVTDGAISEGAGFTLPDPATATSGPEGNVDFGEITFTDEGTYEVTIREANAPVEHVTFDTHELTYTVSVTRANGELVASVVDGSVEGSTTFTNTYYDPEQAKDAVDATPDDGLLVGDTIEYTDRLGQRLRLRRDRDRYGQAARRPDRERGQHLRRRHLRRGHPHHHVGPGRPSRGRLRLRVLLGSRERGCRRDGGPGHQPGHSPGGRPHHTPDQHHRRGR